MTKQYDNGYLVGDGAAQNVSIGWIPDAVKVVNLTDADKVTFGNFIRAMAFTSGGTTEIAAGDLITGATSGATATVRQVLLSSGSWAGADAAGFFLFNIEDKTGTFQSENVYVGSGTNDATVTVDAAVSYSYDTEVAVETGNAAITAYVGSSTAAKGFTIGSTVSEEAKLLFWEAWRKS